MHPDDEARAKAWEMAAYDYLRNNFHNDLIEILLLGNEIVDYELKEDGRKMAPYFVVGEYKFSFKTIIIFRFYVNNRICRIYRNNGLYC